MISSRLGNAYDSLVGIFSPRKALLNQYLRQKNEKMRSEQYAAAKSHRLTGNWLPANSNVNDIIGASSDAVRGRVRQLVRDFPYFASAVNRLVDFSVGEGIIFQSKAQDGDGKPNRKLIQRVEDVFNFWADDCDISKKLHFYEIMQLAKRQDIESGEFIIVKRYTKDRNRYLPYKLQIFETDWITTQNDTYYGGKLLLKSNTSSSRVEIYQGVEFDRFTGETLAFHFYDPDGWGDVVRIPASDIIHGFQTLRPGQLRGISPFAPGVLLANDLSDYMTATIDTAKMAAKYLAFVKSPTMQSRQLGLTTATNEDENTRYIDEMENAIIEYLNPGEEIQIATNPNPGANVMPFTRLIVTMLSVVTGVPYEILSGDYQGVNYSTLRSSRNDFAQSLRPVAVRHIRQFCNATVKPFFNVAVMAGKINFPAYESNPEALEKTEWQPPGMQSIDPLKENKADADAIMTKLKSPQERILARGKDPEEVLKEIKQWREWLKEYGLEDEPVEEPSKASANNPAAVVKQK